MALDKDRLGDAIAAYIISQMSPTPTTEIENDIKSKWKAISDEIISEYVDNGDVDVTVTGVTGTGTPGGPLPISSQPGSGGIS